MGPAHSGRVVALLVEDNGGALRLLVTPELGQIVADRDQLYVDALLRDFLLRARLDPAALFRQIESLCVGPILTGLTGDADIERGYLVANCSEFQIVLPG